MPRLPRLVLALLLLAAPCSFAGDPLVFIDYPSASDFAVGEVVIQAEVMSNQPVTLVEFLVDGRSVGMMSSPPYELKIDVGPGGLEHSFEVIAHAEDGSKGLASVTTQPLPIGGEVNINLQQLYVVVSKNGQRVANLDSEAFRIWDEGIGQKIVSFALGDIPFTAVLLIDASSSMQGKKVKAAYAGARSFVQGMRELDEARVITFSDRMLGAGPFTSDKAMLSAELSGSLAQGGTALNDHLFVALKALEQRKARRVVVLLSDGVDTHSVLSADAVFRKAQQSQAIIYWIRLSRGFGTSTASNEMPSLTSMWHNVGEYRRQIGLLEQMVEDSGGYISHIKMLEEIRPVFEGILRDLREQYVIGYYPTHENNDGRWHSVKVRVKGLNYDIRTHKGYIDF